MAYPKGKHENPILILLAVAFTGALALGLVTKRLGLSPLVGYQLAEIGVVLLMFGVGIHFHLKDLLAVRKVALTGALGQSTAATLVTVAAATALGLPWVPGVLLGLAVSVTSTVASLRLRRATRPSAGWWSRTSSPSSSLCRWGCCSTSSPW